MGRSIIGEPVMPNPEELEAALEGNPRARANFDAFPPFSRKAYVHWIGNAKREATRRRRLSEAIELIERNVKLPLDNG